MQTNTFNPAGLAYLSLTYQIGSNDPVTLTPGESNAVSPDSTFEIALQTETPTLQTVNYYFDGRQYPVVQSWYTTSPFYVSVPPELGGTNTSPTDDGWEGFWNMIVPVPVTNQVIVAQVGRAVNLQAWSQVIAVRPTTRLLPAAMVG